VKCKHCDGTGGVEPTFIIEATYNGERRSDRWAGYSGTGVSFDTLLDILSKQQSSFRDAALIVIKQGGLDDNS
jgi:hypothetical protein